MRTLFSLLAFVSVLSAFSPESAQASGSSATIQTWQHHIDSWNQRNLNEIVADYTPASVVIVNGKTYRGRQEIRGLFEQLFRIFRTAQNHVIHPVVVEEAAVYIGWRVSFDTWYGAHLEIENASDTFVFEGDTIKLQTITVDPRFFSVEKSLGPFA